MEKLLPVVAIVASIAFAAGYFLSPRTDKELEGSDFGRTIKQEEADLDRTAARWELLTACIKDRTRPGCAEIEEGIE